MTYMSSLESMIFAFRWAAVQSEFRSSVALYTAVEVIIVIINLWSAFGISKRFTT